MAASKRSHWQRLNPGSWLPRVAKQATDAVKTEEARRIKQASDQAMRLANLGRALGSDADTAALVGCLVEPLESGLPDREIHAVIREPGRGDYVCYLPDGAVAEQLRDSDLPARFDPLHDATEIFPLVTDTELFGLLVVQSETGVPLTPDELESCSCVADHLAVALECATLDAHGRALLGRRLQTDGPRAIELTRRMRQLSHDMRSPLAAILMQIELLTIEGSPEPSESLKRALGRIRSSAEELGDLVEHHVDPVRAEPEQLEPYLPQTPLIHAVELACRKLGAAEAIDLDLPSGLLAHVDAQRLERIVALILDNACRHGRVPVRVSADADAMHVTLHVADGGDGVPQADRERIFLPFFSTIGNGGWGLPIARQLARSVKGEIWLEDSREGAMFAVRLPRAHRSKRLGE